LHLNSMEQCLILRSEKCLILCCYFLLPPLPVIVFHNYYGGVCFMDKKFIPRNNFPGYF
jgi:hypothetical protein